MSEDDRIEVALWKLSVLGPLVSARLEHGDRLALCQQIAERVHERPDDRAVRISPRTVESWLYAYRRGGLEALKPGRRSDRGRARAIWSPSPAARVRLRVNNGAWHPRHSGPAAAARCASMQSARCPRSRRFCTRTKCCVRSRASLTSSTA